MSKYKVNSGQDSVKYPSLPGAPDSLHCGCLTFQLEVPQGSASVGWDPVFVQYVQSTFSRCEYLCEDTNRIPVATIVQTEKRNL